MQHFRVRRVLAEKSDEAFIEFDNCKASRFWKCSRYGADAGFDFQNVAMTVSVPRRHLRNSVFVAYRYMGLRAWHAIVALIFGFLLAATTAAPEIHSLLSGLANWLNKP